MGTMEIGQGALAKALERAKTSHRAAKVAALLVPLATIAASHANAIVSAQPCPGVVCSGSTSFSLNGESGSASWNVTSGGGSYEYNIGISLSGSSGMTEIDIPLTGAAPIFDPTTPSGWTQVSDTDLDFTASTPQFTFDWSFGSDTAPVFATYTVFGDNSSAGVNGAPADPPIPGPAPVPEPGTLSLLGMGLLGLAGLRRRLTR